MLGLLAATSALLAATLMAVGGMATASETPAVSATFDCAPYADGADVAATVTASGLKGNTAYNLVTYTPAGGTSGPTLSSDPIGIQTDSSGSLDIYHYAGFVFGGTWPTPPFVTQYFIYTLDPNDQQSEPPLGQLLASSPVYTTPFTCARGDLGGGMTYVALGDSYSAGEGAGAHNYFQAYTTLYACDLVIRGITLTHLSGLPRSIPGWKCASYQVGHDNSCHRAPTAWNYDLSVLAAAIPDWTTSNETSDVRNIACTGAKIDDVLSQHHNGDPPQISSLKALNAANAVDLVTITIGGNDLGFSTIIAECFLSPIACDQGRLKDDGSNPHSGIGMTSLRIKNQVIPAIRAAAPNAKIVVVGYPRVMPSTAKLFRCGQFTNSERDAINRYIHNIDKAWRAQTLAAGAYFADVENALNGHELCTKNSHMNPIFGNPFNQEQAHPTPAGQEDIAENVYMDLVRQGIIAG